MKLWKEKDGSVNKINVQKNETLFSFQIFIVVLSFFTQRALLCLWFYSVYVRYFCASFFPFSSFSPFSSFFFSLSFFPSLCKIEFQTREGEVRNRFFPRLFFSYFLRLSFCRSRRRRRWEREKNAPQFAGLNGA